MSLKDDWEALEKVQLVSSRVDRSGNDELDEAWTVTAGEDGRRYIVDGDTRKLRLQYIAEVEIVGLPVPGLARIRVERLAWTWPGVEPFMLTPVGKTQTWLLDKCHTTPEAAQAELVALHRQQVESKEWSVTHWSDEIRAIRKALSSALKKRQAYRGELIAGRRDPDWTQGWREP